MTSIETGSKDGAFGELYEVKNHENAMQISI